MIKGKYYVIDSHCHIYPEKIASLAINHTDEFYSEHSHCKGTIEDLPPHFFLNYNPYEGNSVEIICSTELSNGVTADSLRNCLLKSK